MNSYVILLKKDEDNTIDIRIELLEKGEVYYCKLNNGEIVDGNIEENIEKIPETLFGRIELYKESSVDIKKLTEKNEFKIKEKSYEELFTIGLKPDWRFTASKEVNHRKVAEITFIEMVTKKEFIFHYDPKDKIFKIFQKFDKKKLDVTTLLEKDYKEKLFKYFMDKSRYRIKLIYLKNFYR